MSLYWVRVDRVEVDAEPQCGVVRFCAGNGTLHEGIDHRILIIFYSGHPWNCEMGVIFRAYWVSPRLLNSERQ